MKGTDLTYNQSQLYSTMVKNVGFYNLHFCAHAFLALWSRMNYYFSLLQFPHILKGDIKNS